MRVLVTGAGGFVGRPLCQRLVRDGHEVIAAVRRETASVPGVHSMVTGDLREIVDWRMVDGCDVVVHLAAHVHRMAMTPSDVRLFEEVNVVATSKLVAAAKRAGVRRVVMLSTAKVHGETSGHTPFVESAAVAPEDDYARSKLDAELAVRESGVPFVILRPPLVYGPGVKANFLDLMRAVWARRPLPLGLIDNRRSFVFVGNLVNLVARCLTADLSSESTFLVRDDEDVSSRELVTRVASALGVKERLLPVPVTLLKFAGAMMGQRKRMSRLLDSFQINDGRVRRELNWSPPFSMKQGLAETAEWFQKEVDR